MKRLVQRIFLFTLDFQGYCADASETAETMDGIQAAEKKTEAMPKALKNCCRATKKTLKWVKLTKFSEKNLLKTTTERRFWGKNLQRSR